MVIGESLTEVCILGKGINLTKIKSSIRHQAEACGVLSSESFLSVPWSMKAKGTD